MFYNSACKHLSLSHTMSKQALFAAAMAACIFCYLYPNTHQSHPPSLLREAQARTLREKPGLFTIRVRNNRLGEAKGIHIFLFLKRPTITYFLCNIGQVLKNGIQNFCFRPSVLAQDTPTL